MDQATALAALHRGELVAIITLRANFSHAIAQGEETTISVSVDNVNTDTRRESGRADGGTRHCDGEDHRL